MVHAVFIFAGRAFFSVVTGLEMALSAPQIWCAVARTGPLAAPERHDGFRRRSNASRVAQQENRTMRHVDFSPLYRSTVGFDRLFTMLDSLGQPANGQSYPPYNIERTGEDAYRISMAVAGFSENDISIEAHRNVPSIKGGKAGEQNAGSAFLHRGIAARAFERRFQLADHVEVLGAELRNGLLHIELKRNIPEEMKPRRIAISADPVQTRQIEAHAA